MARKKLSPKYFVGCLVIVLLACGSEQPNVKDSSLRLDLIEQAMDAVDTGVGDDQAYFEINVTDSVVNLFFPLILMVNQILTDYPMPWSNTSLHRKTVLRM